MTAPHQAEAEARLLVDAAFKGAGAYKMCLDIYRDAVAARVRAEERAKYGSECVDCGGNGVTCAHCAADAPSLAYARGRADTLAEVCGIVETEEEASGPMPDAVWDQFQMAVAWGDDRSGATSIIRGTIAATKKSILARLTPTEGTTP